MPSSSKRAPLRIGTAGWGVPARYVEGFPREGSHLERYAQRLNAVEINSSFHQSHRRKVYERWAASTPPDFQFAVKVPKTMTHERSLSDCAALIDRFAEEVGGLGDKLAVLLIQLPPSAVLKKRTADSFFRRLCKILNVPLALEPRHPSWFTPAVESWLTERRIARVGADPIPRRVLPGSGAARPGGWDGLAYYRWHGSPRMYFSDYPVERLRTLRRDVAKLRRAGQTVWCIFDNTGGGHALGDALWLAGSNDPA
jgi:uncharacterized protein YecE (DUF72 family)